MNRLCWAVTLAASAVGACAEHPPAPVPPMQPDAPRPVVAAGYALGSWRLGEPLSTLASSQPDLWSRRHVDAGRRDALALTIGLGDGRATPDRKDRAASGELAFVGASGSAQADVGSLVPVRVIALGGASLERFSPALPPLTFDDAALGPITFLVELPLDAQDTDIDGSVQAPVVESTPQQRAAQERPRPADQPYLLRVEVHDSRVARVMVDGKPVGYVLGDVPSDASDGFHRGLRRRVKSLLGLR